MLLSHVTFHILTFHIQSIRSPPPFTYPFHYWSISIFCCQSKEGLSVFVGENSPVIPPCLKNRSERPDIFLHCFQRSANKRLGGQGFRADRLHCSVVSPAQSLLRRCRIPPPCDSKHYLSIVCCKHDTDMHVYTCIQTCFTHIQTYIHRHTYRHEHIHTCMRTHTC